jgi:phosphoribosyl-ATP pyrophosphohydrolase
MSFAEGLGYSVEDTFRHYESGRPTQELVRHFLHLYHPDFDTGEPLSWRELMERDDRLSEEVDELRHELGKAKPDIVKIAHEAADVMYVLYGLAERCGFDLDACVREVHRANMTKSVSPSGGKAIKGEHFVPANIEGIVHG